MKRAFLILSVLAPLGLSTHARAEIVGLYCKPYNHSNVCPSHIVIDSSAQTITASWCGGGDGTLHGTVTISDSKINVEESESPFDNYIIDRATGRMSITATNSDGERYASSESACQTKPPSAVEDSPELAALMPKAERGDARYQYKVAKLYADGDGKKLPAGNYTEAAPWYQKAAEQGVVRAQYDLGLCYYSGLGVEKSATEAAKWFLKAAERGHAEAQFELGFMYIDEPHEIEENDAEAVKWLRKAADQNNADAQHWLASMYSQGKGVKQDDAEAYYWQSLSAKAGNRHAAENLADDASKLAPDQKAVVDRRVSMWRPSTVKARAARR